MLHPRELQVLNTIAKMGIPAIAIDIAAESKISQSTVQSVLRKLLVEGYVDTVGIVHSSNVFSRQFIITEKAKIEIINQVAQLLNEVKYIISSDEIWAAIKNEDKI